jgi:Flp pilus assembly protein TadG
MTAGMLVAFLALVALVIALGTLIVEHQGAQSAADAASLAAVQDLPLPTNTTQASTDASSYALTNDSNVAVTSSTSVITGKQY